MENNTNDLSLETPNEKRPSKFRKRLRLLFEIIGIILIFSLATSPSDKVPKEDYDALQSEHETLLAQYNTVLSKYESLQPKYDKASSDLKAAKTALDDTLSDYEKYQKRMMPFDQLTDDELNTVASRITQTLEAQQAEEAATQAQAEADAKAAAQAQAEADAKAAAQAQAEAQAKQPAQESMVWIPRTGSKYHSRSSCSNMKNPSQVPLSQAQASGYEPCKKCY